MNTHKSLGLAGLLSLAMLAGASAGQLAQTAEPEQPAPIQLGVFSVSLAVKDIKLSKAFYEKLDFKEVGGQLEQNWIILQNGTTTIGLFQGMFERNALTFNPGWTIDKETLKEFQDVRELQGILKGRGLKMTIEADPKSTGPANFVLVDPDGNPIFVDQHVASPKK